MALDPGSPPLLAPVGGWSPQLTDFLYGMVLADTVNAALALGFVYGYFARLRGHAWLGTLTLTVSIYAAVVFTYGTLAVGAWIGHLADYLAFYLPFIPVIVLFAWWCTRRARDR